MGQASSDLNLVQEAMRMAQDQVAFDMTSVDKDAVKGLPMEDGLWCIAVVDGPGGR